MKRLLIVLGGLALAIILLGGGFLFGMNMGKAQAQDAQNAFFASRGVDPNNPGGGFAGGGFAGRGAGGTGTGTGTGTGGAARQGAVGMITKVDGNTITVTDAQSETLTVQIADTTPIMKTVAGTKSDLTVGTNVVVVGARSGNNISATTIQLTNGQGGAGGFFGGGGGGGGGRRTPTPTP